MNSYNALVKRSSEGMIENVVLLKEGFSFLAFFFSILWFCYHRMWKEVFALVVITILIALLSTTFLPFNKALLELFFAFMIALNANYWLYEHLKKKKGYEFVGIVFGKSYVDAELYFAKSFESHVNQFGDAFFNPKLHRIKLKKAVA